MNDNADREVLADQTDVQLRARADELANQIPNLRTIDSKAEYGTELADIISELLARARQREMERSLSSLPTEMEEDLRNRFGYHPATTVTAPLHAEIRDRFLSLAIWVGSVTSASPRDRALAWTELQSAMHWTNSAVAMSTPLAGDPERARQ